ncbi:AraC family transcriptional regulator [Phaeobacter sp. B1627]|uniref:AraC family transcriptional regulator n=1 Tax=Phaeobacter sp. B1627 TaxID=2583809 RepID=UPI00111B1284|nr:AraC family transcriptional regulator [Phaeobacter sp. B1627]TNJ42078.1 AraC family transcriptional regulator [Phaeobacter sp. B1627]
MKDVFAPNGGAFLSGVLEYASAQGLDLPTALKACTSLDGTAETLSASLPVHEHAAVLHTAETLCDDPHIGIRLAEQTTLRRGGLIGYAIGASGTVAEALRTLARLSDVFRISSPGALSAVTSGPIEVCWDYGTQGQLDLRHWSEFTAAMLVKSLRELGAEAIVPAAVDFTHGAAPPSQVALAALGVVPRYNARVNRIRFKGADALQPLRSADAGLLQLLLEHAELLQRVETHGQTPTAVAVERLIMERMSEGEASLANVAGSLGVSQRTLSRKLASEGTSFFSILEGLRKSLALRYLRQNEKSLSEISYLLGYSSLSSFNDAFRRWTGQSPGSYRSRKIPT